MVSIYSGDTLPRSDLLLAEAESASVGKLRGDDVKQTQKQ